MSSFERGREAINEGPAPRHELVPSWSRELSPEVRRPSWLSPALEVREVELGRESDSDASGLYARVLQPANRGSFAPLVVPTEHRPTVPPVRPAATPGHAPPVEPPAPRPPTLRPSILRLELEAERASLEALREDLENAREEAREMTRRLAEQAAELAITRREAVLALDTRVVELAMVVAETIVGHAARRDAELASRFVREALQQLTDAPRAVVRAAPSAAAALYDVLGGDRGELEGVHLELKRDATLEGFDCVVETPSQRVDARVRERLDAIARALLAEVASDPSEPEVER